MPPDHSPISCRSPTALVTLADVEISLRAQAEDQLWSVTASPGRADRLLHALDPDLPWVLIETWDGQADWHEAMVSVGVHEEPRVRLVRHHSFDLLTTPAEAREIGAHLHAQGILGGGLVAFQFRSKPRPTFRLPDYAQGQADAMRGHGVELVINLPHDGEVAVVTSLHESAAAAYAERLRAAAASPTS